MSDGCVNCGGVLGRDKYRPYCLTCWNACVPELVEARDRLRAALEKIAGEFNDSGFITLDAISRIRKTAQEALK